MKSKALNEWKRPFGQENRLIADQRHGAPYHFTKVRGSDECTLDGRKLEAENEFFMFVLKSNYKRPFYCVVIEVKSFTFKSESS